MFIDNYGTPVYSENDIIEILYHSTSIDYLVVESFTKEIQQLMDISDIQFFEYQKSNINLNEFDKDYQNHWFMPEEYKNYDIAAWIINNSPIKNLKRITEELEEYKSRNLIDLLRWLKYFVDNCRKNNILWGVGRGSSIASYVLYIIGVHKIDSVKYNIPYTEFFK